MPQIEWSDELSLGLEELDEQHKQLIDIANEVLDGLEQGLNKSELTDIFSRLSEYTIRHFTSEEEFMDRVGYPNKKEHAQEHERLRRDVKQFQRKLFQQEEMAANDVLVFLKVWLLQHILQQDRDIAKYCKHGQ